MKPIIHPPVPRFVRDKGLRLYLQSLASEQGIDSALSLSPTLFSSFPPTYLFLFFRLGYTGAPCSKTRTDVEAHNCLYARTPIGGGGGWRWSTELKSQGQGLACATFSAAVYYSMLLLLWFFSTVR